MTVTRTRVNRKISTRTRLANEKSREEDGGARKLSRARIIFGDEFARVGEHRVREECPSRYIYGIYTYHICIHTCVRMCNALRALRAVVNHGKYEVTLMASAIFMLYRRERASRLFCFALLAGRQTREPRRK